MSASDRSTPTPPWQVWSAAVVGIGLIVARKPWALTTPQLWAEDGSVFLTQNDQWGAGAFFVPFQGYLHLLPRLIAWAASRLVDVAAWPLFYNASALLVTLLLFARLASARLDLPGKPWMMLAFGLVAQTGEVLLNITNLQWLTAFFLVAQLLMPRPDTTAQRWSDWLLTLVVGLTGPFALLLSPLFAWRWWRDRHRDNLALLLVVGACAVVTATMAIKNASIASEAVQPLHPLMLLAVLGSRLVVWPVLGARIAESLPLPALAVIGSVMIATLTAWTLRAHPRRTLRAQILLALLILAAAGVWRVRPDTWETANLANGDRYFFIPRVLLAWLLIWEFDARPAVVAWIARACCLAGALTALPQLRIAAPPDYHWAAKCDSIRRGVPANIPTLPEGWTLEYPGRRPVRP